MLRSACRSRPMAGKATLTTNESIISIARPRQAAESVSHLDGAGDASKSVRRVGMWVLPKRLAPHHKMKPEGYGRIRSLPSAGEIGEGRQVLEQCPELVC